MPIHRWKKRCQHCVWLSVRVKPSMSAFQLSGRADQQYPDPEITGNSLHHSSTQIFHVWALGRKWSSGCPEWRTNRRDCFFLPWLVVCWRIVIWTVFPKTRGQQDGRYLKPTDITEARLNIITELNHIAYLRGEIISNGSAMGSASACNHVSIDRCQQDKSVGWCCCRITLCRTQCKKNFPNWWDSIGWYASSNGDFIGDKYDKSKWNQPINLAKSRWNTECWVPSARWHAGLSLAQAGRVKYSIWGPGSLSDQRSADQLPEGHIGLFWGVIPHRLIECENCTQMGVINIPLSHFLALPLMNYYSIKSYMATLSFHQPKICLVTMKYYAGTTTVKVIRMVCISWCRKKLCWWWNVLPSVAGGSPLHTEPGKLHSLHMNERKIRYIPGNAEFHRQTLPRGYLGKWCSWTKIQLHPNYAMNLFKQVMGYSIKRAYHHDESKPCPGFAGWNQSFNFGYFTDHRFKIATK